MARVEFFESICAYHKVESLQKIQTAYWLSKNVHRPQTRDTGERYFEHPLRVARTLIDLGYHDADTIVTALLHDVIEDSFMPEHVIVDLFGRQIWQNLNLLTKSRPKLDILTLEMISMVKRDKESYFNDIACSNKVVKLVKVADRLDNLGTFSSFAPDRKARYIQETEQYIIPIARETDLRLLDKIEKILSQEKNANVSLQMSSL